jgi:cytochrome c nitrite reductase small subunit
VHEPQSEAFQHGGAHRRKRCVDCHLPNDNIPRHFFWKGIDGMKDVAAFYSGRFPEELRLSRHGRSVLQGNCIRCHENMVMRVDPERMCWECHRRIQHKGTALMRP